MVVLAGGASRRMGRDKALLQFDDTTLLARTVVAAQALSDDVLVVGRQALPGDCPPVRAIPDLHPGSGPLGGLFSGVQGARSDRVVCVACDLPFLRAKLLRFLAGALRGYDAVVPVVDGRPQPLHAVYDRQATLARQAQLTKGDRSMSALLERLDVRYPGEEELRRFDPELRSFINVNTPEDWLSALARLDLPPQ